MYTVKVHYFALLREKSGIEEELLFSKAKTYAELYQELSDKYLFNLPLEMIQLAVNDEFCSMHSQIIDHSKVVFIPPVAGG